MSTQAEKLEGLEHLFDGRDTDGIANLTIGAPGPSTLLRLTSAFRDACAHRADISEASNGVMFQYGPRSGYHPFLDRLTELLNEGYGSYQTPVDRRCLVLTGGATVGLWLAATAFLPPGRGVVFIECPSYFIALNILKNDLGHKICPVPMSEDGTGVDLDFFEKIVAKEFANREKTPDGKFWSLFYTIPTFHNPTGSLLTPEKSKKLVQLARKYDVLVFCDDVYNLLHYGEGTKSPPRLFHYDNKEDSDYKGNVISNGTFSKILGPGYRVGWLEIAPWMKEPLKDTGIILSGGSMNNVAAGIVASAIDLGLQKKHLEYLRKLYFERLEAMFGVLDKKLPEGFSCMRPWGGYFVWLKGPETFDSAKFAEWCLANYKVQVLPSNRCVITDLKTCTNAFRMSFAFYEADVLKQSMEKLCDALKNFK